MPRSGKDPVLSQKRCTSNDGHGLVTPISGLRPRWRSSSQKISYKGYRFPLEIIPQAIWLYVRFTLSFRDVEDLLAERGIMVSYETVRRWVNHFGPMIAANLRKRRPKPYTTRHLDEVYLKIDGRMIYLWRAVDARRAKKPCPGNSRSDHRRGRSDRNPAEPGKDRRGAAGGGKGPTARSRSRCPVN